MALRWLDLPGHLVEMNARQRAEGSAPVDGVARGQPVGRSGDRLRGLASTAGVVLLVAWALVNLYLLLGQVRSQGERGAVDFFTFYVSAAEWRAGRDPYAAIRIVEGPDGAPVMAHANLNHPAMIPPFAPLTVLSPAVAFSAWNALSLLAWAVAVVVALRVAGAAAGMRAWLVVAALAASLPGAIYGLQIGQVALLLTLVAVGCWAGLRHPVGTKAGLAGAFVLGALVALKPFFAPVMLVFVPRRDWRALLAAGSGGVAISLVALPFMGVGAFRTWLGLSRTVDWYDHSLNIGLAGILWRVAPSPPPTVVTWIIAASVALVAAATLRLPPPRGLRRVDRDFALLLLASLLGSPLGWLYYTPLFLPAFAILFAARDALSPVTRRLAIVSCALLWIPHLLLLLFPEAAWSQLTLRATPAWGLLLLWGALALPGRMATAEDGGDISAAGRGRSVGAAGVGASR